MRSLRLCEIPFPQNPWFTCLWRFFPSAPSNALLIKLLSSLCPVSLMLSKSLKFKEFLTFDSDSDPDSDLDECLCLGFLQAFPIQPSCPSCLSMLVPLLFRSPVHHSPSPFPSVVKPSSFAPLRATSWILLSNFNRCQSVDSAASRSSALQDNSPSTFALTIRTHPCPSAVSPRSTVRSGPRAQPSAAALLTPKNPFCHCIILNLKWYEPTLARAMVDHQNSPS